MLDQGAASPLCPHPLPQANLDSLIAHPHWEPLGPTLDALVATLPRATERAERTTLLTWVYQQRGVATFGELSDRLTGLASLPKRKKHLRQALRAMEKLRMLTIVNFPGEDDDAPGPDEDVVGRNSLVSLTWTGMLWLRRAWAAREPLSRDSDPVRIHQQLVSEEDEAGWNDPYWIENVTNVDPDASCRQASPAGVPCAGVRSIFELSREAGDCNASERPAPC